MKSPREVLFERHRAVKTKLDAIRQTVLENLPDSRSRRGAEADSSDHGAVRLLTSAATRFLGAREFVRSVRWHLAGMTAVWLLIALLNMDRSAAPATIAAKPSTPSPQRIVTALLEHRRQIAELLESPADLTDVVPAPRELPPRRRSEVSSLNALA